MLRTLADGTFRIEPVERRQPELIVDADESATAPSPAISSRSSRSRAGRYGLPRGKVLAVLGSLTSEKAVSMIAIHAHDIPHIFPPDVLAEAEAVKPATHGAAARTGATCRWSPSIRPTPRTMTTPSTPSPTPTPDNPGGVIVTVAIADVAGLCAARHRRSTARR